MDSGSLGVAAGLFLFPAAANAESRINSGQYQLRLGHRRYRGANLGATLCLAGGGAARLADLGLCADALRPDAFDAQNLLDGGALMLAPAAKPPRRFALRLALRFALRELRGGLRGFGVFIACIALGVMAIAGVGSVAASLNDGISSAGRVILGGDLAFSLLQREASAAERAFLDAHGTVSVAASLRAMARTGDGRSTLVEIKAVDADYPLFGSVATDPV